MKQIFFLFLVLTMTSAFESGPDLRSDGFRNARTEAEGILGGAYLMFAGKHGGDITRADIERHRELRVDGCAWQAKVIRYSLAVVKGGKTSTFQGQSSLLTEEIMAQLKSLSKGDSFEFSQVKANMPNGKDTVDVHAKKFVVV